MRYDITLSVVVSVEADDVEEARDFAERASSYLEREIDWLASDRLTGPPTLSLVDDVVEIN